MSVELDLPIPLSIGVLFDLSPLWKINLFSAWPRNFRFAADLETSFDSVSLRCGVYLVYELGFISGVWALQSLHLYDERSLLKGIYLITFVVLRSFTLDDQVAVYVTSEGVLGFATLLDVELDDEDDALGTIFVLWNGELYFKKVRKEVVFDNLLERTIAMWIVVMGENTSFNSSELVVIDTPISIIKINNVLEEVVIGYVNHVMDARQLFEVLSERDGLTEAEYGSLTIHNQRKDGCKAIQLSVVLFQLDWNSGETTVGKQVERVVLSYIMGSVATEQRGWYKDVYWWKDECCEHLLSTKGELMLMLLRQCLLFFWTVLNRWEWIDSELSSYLSVERSFLNLSGFKLSNYVALRRDFFGPFGNIVKEL